MPKKKAAGGKGKSAPKKKKSAKKLVKAKSTEELPPPPVEAKPSPNNCVYHVKEMTYYWETWETPIWYHCTVMGPHNTQLHRISTINDAFSNRYDMMVNAIKNTLIPKRTQLIAQITRVDYRVEEIKTVKGIIDRDIKNEYGGIIERLASAEGVKLAILQHDISEVQKDVNRIDEILQHLDELNGATPAAFPSPQIGEGQPVQPLGGQGINMIGFLSRYKKLQEDVDYAITKQFKVEVSVIPNDLPRELAEKRAQLEEYEKQKGILKQKNDIILKLVEEKKVRENTIKDELDRQTRREITQWINLVDNYASELKKLQLVCTFWGVHLDHIAINLDWPQNPLIGDVKDFVPPAHLYSSIVPPKEFFATGRHFFVQPDEAEDENTNESRLMLNEEILQDNEYAARAVDKIRETYTPEKEQELEDRLRHMAIQAAERQGRDPDDSGVVTRKDFEFLLKSEFDLTGREVQNLLELITPSLEDKINFKSFFRFLRRPADYEDSFKRGQYHEEENIEEAFDNTLKRATHAG